MAAGPDNGCGNSWKNLVFVFEIDAWVYVQPNKSLALETCKFLRVSLTTLKIYCCFSNNAYFLQGLVDIRAYPPSTKNTILATL